MGIYTKKGDDGMTSLSNGERVRKDDPRVEAYGTVDELSAFTAYLRDSFDTGEPYSESSAEEYRDDLKVILNTLMSVEALLANGEGSEYKITDISDTDTGYLEQRIDYISNQLKPVTRFTIPGGHPLISLCHICRTVCRRAERTAISAAGQFNVSQNAITYLNRLSDYFYVLGRKICEEFATEEEYWEPTNV